jgi:hypothetical protein
MKSTPTILPTDTWIAVNWDEFIQISENPDFAKAKGYYYSGKMLIDTTILVITELFTLLSTCTAFLTAFPSMG